MKIFTEKLYYNKILGQFVFSFTQKILVNVFHFEVRNLCECKYNSTQEEIEK